MDSESLSNLRDSIATAAEKAAMKKSRIFGEILASISGVSLYTHNIFVRKYAKNIGSKIENSKQLALSEKDFEPPLAIA
jgi:hypothetical protein